MAESPRYSSPRNTRVSTALASVTLLLSGGVVPGSMLRAPVVEPALSASAPGTVLAAVRPRVAVRVLIESDLYRRKLDGAAGTCGTNCAMLQRALRDTVRALFAARFRFADWQGGDAPTRDTVSITLMQHSANASAVKMVVALQGRARQFGGTPEAVDFEQFLFIALRPATDWTPDRMRGIWADSLARRLDAFGARILANVIGRLPLTGDVVLDPARPSADVRLPADSLRAADAPAPKFLVRLAMPSATAGGDIVSDTGELVLAPCRRTNRGFYACEMSVFRWRDRSGSDTLFRQKARNATVSTASVHLQEYTPLSSTLDAGGLAAPRIP